MRRVLFVDGRGGEESFDKDEDVRVRVRDENCTLRTYKYTYMWRDGWKGGLRR